MRHITILSLVVALAACGGGETQEPSGQSVPNGIEEAGPCTPMADYVRMSAYFIPRPEMQDGWVWHAPFLLKPATPESTAPSEAAPGFIGTPVVVGGPQGQPMTIHGPYYVPGEIPAFVCVEPSTL